QELEAPEGTVIPAKAGIQVARGVPAPWIPASAGMTNGKALGFLCKAMLRPRRIRMFSTLSGDDRLQPIDRVNGGVGPLHDRRDRGVRHLLLRNPRLAREAGRRDANLKVAETAGLDLHRCVRNGRLDGVVQRPAHVAR